MPGEHNVLNALTALAVLRHAGVDAGGGGAAPGDLQRRRAALPGDWARSDGVVVVDDYAHHPTEIAATLTAAKQGDHERVIAVFQPHLYSRTRYLQREFGRALTLADEAIVTDVFPAREEPEPGVTGKLIVDAYLAERPGGPVAYLPRLCRCRALPGAARAPRRPGAHARRRRRVPRRRAAARHACRGKEKPSPAPNSRAVQLSARETRARRHAATAGEKRVARAFRLLATVLLAVPAILRCPMALIVVLPLAGTSLRRFAIEHVVVSGGQRVPAGAGGRSAAPALSRRNLFTVTRPTCAGTLAYAATCVAVDDRPRLPRHPARAHRGVPAGGLRARRRPLVRGRRRRPRDRRRAAREAADQRRGVGLRGAAQSPAPTGGARRRRPRRRRLGDRRRVRRERRRPQRREHPLEAVPAPRRRRLAIRAAGLADDGPVAVG